MISNLGAIITKFNSSHYQFKDFYIVMATKQNNTAIYRQLYYSPWDDLTLPYQDKLIKTIPELMTFYLIVDHKNEGMDEFLIIKDINLMIPIWTLVIIMDVTNNICTLFYYYFLMNM